MAETKPYSLQSPEQIAKDYGGNKQKIAEAMQMGIVDPTAGTLAAMFIDRMRNAAQVEAAPQATIAQQAFAPPVAPGMGAPAPAGLGATPEAAAMAAPSAALPPAGAGLPAAAPIPGMAMGGLTTLPVPDGMFDEPENGGYAGGGIVAFREGTDADGVEVKTETIPEYVDPEEILVTGQLPEDDKDLFPLLRRGMMFEAPTTLGGFENTLGGNLDILNEEAPRKTERAEQLQAYYDKVLDPEEQKARRKEDMWMALGQLGAKMASTPGSLLQAASAGIGEALPAIQAGNKARRADERAVYQALAGEERTGNKEILDRANVAYEALKNYNVNEKSFQSENFNAMLAKMGIDADVVKTQIMAGAGIHEALIAGSASRYGSDQQLRGYRISKDTQIASSVSDYLKSPQGLAGLNKARKEGVSDADYIRGLRRAFGGDDPAGIRGGDR